MLAAGFHRFSLSGWEMSILFLICSYGRLYFEEWMLDFVTGFYFKSVVRSCALSFFSLLMLWVTLIGLLIPFLSFLIRVTVTENVLQYFHIFSFLKNLCRVDIISSLTIWTHLELSLRVFTTNYISLNKEVAAQACFFLLLLPEIQ